MSKVSLFYDTEPFKITKPIKFIELFAGVGAFSKALENIGADFEIYRACEIDKYALKSYNAIHGTNFEVSNICDLHGEDLGIADTDKFVYMLSYSFPCQDLSPAGNQKGMTKGTGTRSGLLWEVERLLTETKKLPQVLLLENVPQILTDGKNADDFSLWVRFLETLGYTNYYKILNARDYGIPQNRARCFMVSLLGDYTYEFPKSFKLTTRLKDFLETNVDEKYYINDSTVEYFLDKAREAQENSGVKCEQIGVLTGDKWKRMHEISRRVYGVDGLAPTMHTCGGGGQEPKIAEPIIWDGFNQRVRRDQTCIGTLTGNCGADLKRNGQGIIEGYRVRKITPTEAFRLMGFSDEDINKLKNIGTSDSQLYKQAGNSIVVQVLEAVFKQMF